MNQRGSIGIYLLFSIAIAAAAGYGVYRFMRDHKDAWASNKDDDAATTKQASAPAPKPTSMPAPAPAPVPEVVEAEPAIDPMSEAMKLAESRIVEPVLDAATDESPVFGTPGISGGIERGSVERRFKPRAAMLQRCWERSDAGAGSIHVSLRVEPDGKVSHIALSGGFDGLDDGFQACVMSALSFTFSATKDGNPAAVVQPIAFR
jgi:hypothetical protein